jgi:xylan 1,4-beta-xylosidase
MSIAVTIARSKLSSVRMSCFSYPLVSSYGHPELGLQKAGHGSWCDTPDGRTYLAFLCGRPLPGTDCCVLGRETSIADHLGG